MGRKSFAMGLQKKAVGKLNFGLLRAISGTGIDPRASETMTPPPLGGSIRTVKVLDSPFSKSCFYEKGALLMVQRRYSGTCSHSRAPEHHEKPTLDTARAMPLSCQEMDNSALVTLGAMGDYEARKEILVRHIMVEKKCEYDEAHDTYFEKIYEKNKYLSAPFITIPYKIGIGAAMVLGVGSFPMVFSEGTARWFNEFFVTTDVPEPADLETFLEVGAWTWNWMEPVMGQLSFTLLCLQFIRAQIHNLGIKSFTNRVKEKRAETLIKAFPEYEAKIIKEYSMSSHLENAAP